MRSFLLVAVFGLGMPPGAAACPPAPDIAAATGAILAEIRAAPDAETARLLGNQLWRHWARAPDAVAQAILDRGMERRAAYDFEAATAAFDELVAYCPDYAEGYNQRAFVHFIRGDYGLALDDLDRALERNSEHVAAMTGKALALLQLGRIKAGQAVLRAALELNPWLPERAYLIEDIAPEPGEDL